MNDNGEKRELFDQDEVEPLRRSDRHRKKKIGIPFKNARRKENSPQNEHHADDLEESLSRTRAVSEDRERAAEEKTDRLKRKLNIAIACLVVAIVLVYLFMRFVNW